MQSPALRLQCRLVDGIAKQSMRKFQFDTITAHQRGRDEFVGLVAFVLEHPADDRQLRALTKHSGRFQCLVIQRAQAVCPRQHQGAHGCGQRVLPGAC